MRLLILTSLLLTCVTVRGEAQYLLRAHSLNCGGRSMGPPPYRHNGSLGQISGGILQGGDYKATAGFWSFRYGPVTGVDQDVAALPPLHSYLGPCSPNPFRPPRMTIPFQVGGAGDPVPCDLRICDIQGRVVRTLVTAPQTPGIYQVVWDSMDDMGRPVASGIYFCTLHAGAYRSTRRVALIR